MKKKMFLLTETLHFYRKMKKMFFMFYFPQQLISNSMVVSEYLVGNYVVVACYNFYNFNGGTGVNEIILNMVSVCSGRNLKRIPLEETSQKLYLLEQPAL
jgi:hypothetical protein